MFLRLSIMFSAYFFQIKHCAVRNTCLLNNHFTQVKLNLNNLLRSDRYIIERNGIKFISMGHNILQLWLHINVINTHTVGQFCIKLYFNDILHKIVLN